MRQNQIRFCTGDPNVEKLRVLRGGVLLAERDDIRRVGQPAGRQERQKDAVKFKALRRVVGSVEQPRAIWPAGEIPMQLSGASSAQPPHEFILRLMVAE